MLLKGQSVKMKQLIVDKCGQDAYDFFNQYVNTESDATLIVSTTNSFNILNSNTKFNSLINLTKVNNVRRINKFFEEVNSKLQPGDYFIVAFQTIQARHESKKINKIPVLKHLYFFFEFVFLRMFPKIWGLKKIYFLITRGRNRLLSKAEVLGRLVSCGFKIVDVNAFKGISYAVVQKEKLPDFNMSPSYGMVFAMNRIGKNGKAIKVYKFRTMHPYAEYLQDYVLQLNGYAHSGKPKNDFRLTPWGKWMRKYWIDELPQIINLLKGDLKLVGVRPISQRYFNDIPKDLQDLRSKFKPGCVPPYVALNRNGDVQSVLIAEREYLKEKVNSPFTTDTKFFFKAIFNILVKLSSFL